MGRALAVIIWILTLGSVSLFFVKKWWFPEAISSHAAALDRQFLLTIIIVGIAFTAAQVGLGYVVWKYRDRGQSDLVTGCGRECSNVDVAGVHGRRVSKDHRLAVAGAFAAPCGKGFPFSGFCLAK